MKNLSSSPAEASASDPLDDPPPDDPSLDALRVSEGRYRRLFETARDGILLLNGETAQIEDVNPYLITMLGYSHAEFLGKKLWEVGAFADIAQSKEMFNEILANGYVRYEDLPLVSSAGERIQVEFVSNSYNCDEVKVIQCNIRNITDRKIAEAKIQTRSRELAESNTALERFAYIASHDLQTPLRNIIHYAQLLDRRYKSQLDADANDFIGFIVGSAKHMVRLIEDILEYSRVPGQSEPLRPISTGEAVARALANLKRNVDTLDAEVHVGDLPVVLGEQTYLVSLFQNLLDNGMKYRAPGRKPALSVTAERVAADRWRFAVTDNGIGIEKEYHDKIFEIFQRLNPAAETEGTGIGLTLCRQIVNRFGGTVWVESVSGIGTTFFFTLRDGSATA